MNCFFTIDTGTTNTRIYLLDARGNVCDTFRADVGVRATAEDGNPDRLTAALRTGIRVLRERHSIGRADICRILASGMITSDMGIFEVPHLTAPAGIADFRKAAKTVLLPEICEVPITFLPGLKNRTAAVDWNHFEEMDMMRGEETEAFAILEDLPFRGECLLVLPGSHTKFVSIGEGKKILGCLTTLSGELLDVVTHHTLLADSVEKKFVSSYEKAFVLAGYRTAKAVGLSRALFSARILGQFAEKDANRLANYLLGAILQSDVEALQKTSALPVHAQTPIFVAGKEPLKRAMIDVLRESGAFREAAGVSSPYESCLSARGAYLILGEKNPV
ncbi:MAG: 2-dehydro-3-deoxygalactonokinase [Eubacteriales bacterium]|nr:2-dehydro-3-deoxygalactonokinase [Eubacteriales bacterium]